MRILSKYKNEPWFVFSGQTDVIKSESSIRSMLEEEDCQRDYADIIYVKSEDNDKLIEDIRSSVSDKSVWQVKNKYKQVLSVFDVIGDDSQGALLDMLLFIEGYKPLDHKVYYTQLRIILEWMFRHANQIGLLHDKCIDDKGKVNLTESSLFLAGEQTKYIGVKCKERHFPKLIAENIKNLLFITGGASHTTEPDDKELINLQDYWKSVNTPYLLYSLIFALCDILVWYNRYQKENNNYGDNVSKWEEVSLRSITNDTAIRFSDNNITGIVEQDDKGNYHCGCYLLPYSSGAELIGKTITITKSKPNDKDHTKGMYEIFAYGWK